MLCSATDARHHIDSPGENETYAHSGSGGERETKVSPRKQCEMKTKLWARARDRKKKNQMRLSSWLSARKGGKQKIV